MSTAAIVGIVDQHVLVVGMLIFCGWFPAGVITLAVLPQAFAEIVIAVIVTVVGSAVGIKMESGGK
ncbi:MAG: hypothetical protein R2851_10225 [Caldilineaceae bacterium]